MLGNAKSSLGTAKPTLGGAPAIKSKAVSKSVDSAPPTLGYSKKELSNASQSLFIAPPMINQAPSIIGERKYNNNNNNNNNHDYKSPTYDTPVYDIPKYITEKIIFSTCAYESPKHAKLTFTNPVYHPILLPTNESFAADIVLKTCSFVLGTAAVVGGIALSVSTGGAAAPLTVVFASCLSGGGMSLTINSVQQISSGEAYDLTSASKATALGVLSSAVAAPFSVIAPAIAGVSSTAATLSAKQVMIIMSTEAIGGAVSSTINTMASASLNDTTKDTNDLATAFFTGLIAGAVSTGVSHQARKFHSPNTLQNILSPTENAKKVLISGAAGAVGAASSSAAAKIIENVVGDEEIDIFSGVLDSAISSGVIGGAMGMASAAMQIHHDHNAAREAVRNYSLRAEVPYEYASSVEIEAIARKHDVSIKLHTADGQIITYGSGGNEYNIHYENGHYLPATIDGTKIPLANVNNGDCLYEALNFHGMDTSRRETVSFIQNHPEKLNISLLEISTGGKFQGGYDVKKLFAAVQNANNLSQEEIIAIGKAISKLEAMSDKTVKSPGMKGEYNLHSLSDSMKKFMAIDVPIGDYHSVKNRGTHRLILQIKNNEAIPVLYLDDHNYKKFEDAFKKNGWAEVKKEFPNFKTFNKNKQ